MRLVVLFIIATIALVSAQVAPPVYAGPNQSPLDSAVPAAGVKLNSATDFLIQWSENHQTMLRGQIGFGLFNGTRIMALLHVAMHDTIQGFDQEFATYQSGLPLPVKANVQAAIMGAAYTIFSSYYSGDITEQVKLNSIVAFQTAILQGANVKTSKINNGFAYGQSIANSLLASRANDGYNNIVPFVPNNADGFWRPTPPDFTPGQGNTWGAVTPWGLTDPNINNYFPTTAGNTYSASNGTRYVTDYTEVIGKGRDTNNFAASPLQRTGVETFIGVWFSNDYMGGSFPPGQYLSVAQIIAKSGGYTRSQAGRLLALEGMNLANANIVGWAVKYAFQEWRPISAILNADTDSYPETTADPTWQPLLVTSPNWPDYVSGHATFGWSSAQLFRTFLGTDNYRISFNSEVLPQVTATYSRWSDFGLDNALSRIFLGVHFRSAVLDAQSSGEAIANDLYNNNLQPL